MIIHGYNYSTRITFNIQKLQTHAYVSAIFSSTKHFCECKTRRQLVLHEIEAICPGRPSSQISQDGGPDRKTRGTDFGQMTRLVCVLLRWTQSSGNRFKENLLFSQDVVHWWITRWEVRDIQMTIQVIQTVCIRCLFHAAERWKCSLKILTWRIVHPASM